MYSPFFLIFASDSENFRTTAQREEAESGGEGTVNPKPSKVGFRTVQVSKSALVYAESMHVPLLVWPPTISSFSAPHGGTQGWV